MSERDFIDFLNEMDSEENEQVGSLMDALKSIYESDVLKEKLVRMILFIWDDYIKAYEYQLRVTDQQEKIDSLNSKLEECQVLIGKQYMTIRKQDEEIEKLKVNQHYNQKEIEMLNKCLKDFGERQVNIAKCKNGNPIAYRKDAGIGIVLALHRQGLLQKEIAERLGVGETTIYRRFKELREAGLIK